MENLNKKTLENVVLQFLYFSYDLHTIYDVRLRDEVIGIHTQGGKKAKNQTEWKILGITLPLKGKRDLFLSFCLRNFS